MNVFQFVERDKLYPSEIPQWSELGRLTVLHQQRKLDIKLHPFIFHNTRHYDGGEFAISKSLRNLSHLQAYDHCLFSKELPISFKVRCVIIMKNLAAEVFQWSKSLAEESPICEIQELSVRGIVERIVILNNAICTSITEKRKELYQQQLSYACKLVNKVDELDREIEELFKRNMFQDGFNAHEAAKLLCQHPVKAYLDVKKLFEESDVEALLMVYESLCSYFKSEEKEKYYNDPEFLEYIQLYIELYEEHALLFQKDAIYVHFDFIIGPDKKKESDQILKLKLLVSNFEILTEGNTVKISNLMEWDYFKQVISTRKIPSSLIKLLKVRNISNELKLDVFSSFLLKVIKKKVNYTNFNEIIPASFYNQKDLREVWIDILAKDHLFLRGNTFTVLSCTGEITEEKGFSLLMHQHPYLSVKEQTERVMRLTKIILSNVYEFVTNCPVAANEILSLVPTIKNVVYHVHSNEGAKELAEAMRIKPVDRLYVEIQSLPPPAPLVDPQTYKGLKQPIRITSSYSINPAAFKGIVKHLPDGSELTFHLDISSKEDLDTVSKYSCFRTSSVILQNEMTNEERKEFFDVFFEWFSSQDHLVYLEVKYPLSLEEKQLIQQQKRDDLILTFS